MSNFFHENYNYSKKALQENEDARKMGEQRSNQAEEALEDLESQLEDAQAVANQDLSRTLSLTKRL